MQFQMEGVPLMPLEALEFMKEIGIISNCDLQVLFHVISKWGNCLKILISLQNSWMYD